MTRTSTTESTTPQSTTHRITSSMKKAWSDFSYASRRIAELHERG